MDKIDAEGCQPVREAVEIVLFEIYLGVAAAERNVIRSDKFFP